MDAVAVSGLGKAYKVYATRFARLAEWLLPFAAPRHRLNWVLRDIDFTIHPGEAVGIIGLNGAGKSTLLKAIAGTTKPTAGAVRTGGRVAALLELGIGFHPDFTGRQNVLMAGQLLGHAGAEIARIMPEIEQFAEIGDYIDQPVRVYSSGMQVRLSFAVATAIRPDVLIVDEALSVGDAYFQAKCYQRINEFKQQGTTLILVSHSPSDVVKHCERAILLKDGRIAADGRSREVINRYLGEISTARPGSSGAAPLDIATTARSGAVKGECEDGDRNGRDDFATRPGYRSDEQRWGQGGAIILDYSFGAGGRAYPARIEGNALADFEFKVRFDADFDSVVPGLLLKTIEGIFLYGTNSLVATEGETLIVARKGDIKTFRFSMPLGLNEGAYLVSFGISSGSPQQELVPLDRRYDAVLIHVGRSTPFSGIVDLNASFRAPESTNGERV